MWVSSVTSRRPSIWPVKLGPGDIGRRRGDRAVDDRRQIIAIAGVGAAQIGHQRMPLPVGYGEKLRRHHPERKTLRHEGAARVAVVAAAELNRGLDQEASSVIADRAERIVVQLQDACVAAAPLRCRRPRAAPASCWRTAMARSTTAIVPAGLSCGGGGGGLPGPGDGFGLVCPGIELRLLAGAIERVESGIGGTAGRGQTILRNLSDPRRRRFVIRVTQLVVNAGVVGVSNDTGLAQRHILRRDEAALDRSKQIGRDALCKCRGGGVEDNRSEARQHQAWQKRA